MENKNINLENQNNKAIAEVQPEKKGMTTKVKEGVKKHWKKALAVLGVGALGFAAGVLSTTAGNCDDDAEEADFEDVEFTVEDDE